MAILLSNATVLLAAFQVNSHQTLVVLLVTLQFLNDPLQNADHTIGVQMVNQCVHVVYH
jgi:hypothetical protein